MNSLKKKPVWVTWRYKDGSKLPLSVITGKKTSTNSLHVHEWTTFDELGEIDKVGFIISLKAISFLMLTTEIHNQKSSRNFSANSQPTRKSR